MSRKKRRRRRIQAVIQGRKLKGHSKVSVISPGTFIYRQFVYSIDDFPPEVVINLDTTGVEPLGEVVGQTKPVKKKKPKSSWPQSKCAFFFSNKADCPDVQTFYDEIRL